MKRLLLIFASLAPMFAFGQICGPYTLHTVISYTGASNVVISGDSINAGGSSNRCIYLYNCVNVHITKCRLLNSAVEAIYAENCTNVTIDSCKITGVITGVNVVTSTAPIVVDHNYFQNMQGPTPKGQFVQFNNVNGAGSSVSYNRMQNLTGTNPEDAISMFQSNGTSVSSIQVVYNIISGGGPSHSGGGIMLGDNGGSYINAQHNVLSNPGQYGMAISGGDHMNISNNQVFGANLSWSNVGIYVYAQAGQTITNSTVSNNSVKWTNSAGADNPYYLAPGETTPTGWSTNNWSASIDATTGVPSPFFASCSVISAPVISYSPSSQTFTVGTTISAYNPTNTGGAASSWSISPSLPAGLNFNTTTGAITGTPSAASSSTSYTVTATNSGGAGSTVITIVVNTGLTAPVISYTPSTNTYSVGTLITPLSPANTGGAATSFSISPALPTGLAFNTGSGVISGTPTVTSASTSYTVTATNTAGSGTAPLNVTVTAPPPLIIFKRKIKMI